MPRTRSGWKSYERMVMLLLGGQRIPITGRHGPGGDPGDGTLPGYYVEVRDRARARPLRWFREVAEGAKAVGGVPLLVFKGPTRALSPLVIMRLVDFEEVRRGGQPGRDIDSGAGGEGAADSRLRRTGRGTGPNLRGLPPAPAARDEGARPGDGSGG